MPAFWMFQKGLDLLQIVTPPVGTLSGLPLAVMPILNALDPLTGLADPLFVASVTATVVSGPGTVTAGGVAVGVLGVVAFVGLTVTGSGDSVLQFSSQGLAPVTATVHIL